MDKIIIGQEMEVEFYFTINTQCTGICNIIHIGNIDTVRTPSLFIINNQFYIAMSNNINWDNPRYVTGFSAIPDDDGEHLFYFQQTVSSKIVKIDGIEYIPENGDFTNTNYQNYLYPIYLSNPWYVNHIEII